MKSIKNDVNCAVEDSNVKQSDTQTPQDDSSILDSLKIEKEDNSSGISTRRG